MLARAHFRYSQTILRKRASIREGMVYANYNAQLLPKQTKVGTKRDATSQSSLYKANARRSLGHTWMYLEGALQRPMNWLSEDLQVQALDARSINYPK